MALVQETLDDELERFGFLHFLGCLHKMKEMRKLLTFLSPNETMARITILRHD